MKERRTMCRSKCKPFRIYFAPWHPKIFFRFQIFPGLPPLNKLWNFIYKIELKYCVASWGTIHKSRAHPYTKQRTYGFKSEPWKTPINLPLRSSISYKVFPTRFRILHLMYLGLNFAFCAFEKSLNWWFFEKSLAHLELLLFWL